MPTTSINSLINEYNKKNNERVPNISLEEMLAIYLEKMEEFYKMFLMSGFAPFESLYYKYWLHTGQVVNLKNYDYAQVRIKGISLETGHLIAESVSGPKVVYDLHPDGNSFDFISGLIGKKQT
ncbi:hypothetical protein BB559_006289 [Furculomyces boomerangus]|uniref:Uncharacterized protein n=1 Tax=Furculomyces boomerangus TaxID=61424 RepID=A0A2T9Y3R4_9FUNG|nr:hypothetical protein BB559_006289 [Furculomyces boomerangus]